MIKTLNNTIKQDRTAYKIPRSVQECHMMEKTHNAYEVYWTGDA